MVLRTYTHSHTLTTRLSDTLLIYCSSVGVFCVCLRKPLHPSPYHFARHSIQWSVVQIRFQVSYFYDFSVIPGQSFFVYIFTLLLLSFVGWVTSTILSNEVVLVGMTMTSLIDWVVVPSTEFYYYEYASFDLEWFDEPTHAERNSNSSLVSLLDCLPFSNGLFTRLVTSNSTIELNTARIQHYHRDSEKLRSLLLCWRSTTSSAFLLHISHDGFMDASNLYFCNLTRVLAIFICDSFIMPRQHFAVVHLTTD